MKKIHLKLNPSNKRALAIQKADTAHILFYYFQQRTDRYNIKEKSFVKNTLNFVRLRGELHNQFYIKAEWSNVLCK